MEEIIFLLIAVLFLSLLIYSIFHGIKLIKALNRLKNNPNHKNVENFCKVFSKIRPGAIGPRDYITIRGLWNTCNFSRQLSREDKEKLMRCILSIGIRLSPEERKIIE